MRLRILTTVTFLLVIFSSFAQTRVNSITKLNQESATYRELNWNNDSLFVAGTTVDQNGWKATIATYSKEGVLTGANYLEDTSTEFGVGYWDKGFLFQDSFIYHIASKGYVSDKHTGLILKLSHSNLELKSKEFESIYAPNENFCRFRDIKTCNEGFVILETDKRNDLDIQSCLLVTDRDFNQVWRKCFGNSNSIEIPEEVISLSNGNFIVISNSTNLDISDQFYGTGNGFYKGYIFEVDNLGQLVWEWKSPNQIEAAYSGILENDSTLIVASGRGKEVCTGPQSNDLCFFTWTDDAYKFNLKTREKIWESSLSGGPYTTQFDNRYYSIIQSIEKDGYILCGSGYDIAFEGCQPIDTTNKCWSYPGVIAKISNEGDSLWMRKYFGVTDIYESNFLYSASIAPDSGYSFVGEAFNPWPGSDQGQFGWLLMTDKYGCLVPGCQLISSTNESSDNSPNTEAIKIYPNPATDFINVLITKEVSSDAALHLYNIVGNEIDHWNSIEQGATYMIPTTKYPAGTYYLVLTDKHFKVYNEKLAIIK